MTLRQVQNISIGYYEGLKREHELRVLEGRVLLTYYGAMKDPKDRRTFEDIYPIEMDSEKDSTKKEKLPKEVFGPMLANFFKSTSK